MKTKRMAAVAGAGFLFGCIFFAGAAPSLPVTKPPVILPTLMTGPPIDPFAARGQWFIDGGGTETVRTNEFHDETAGGLGANAITGYVDGITYALGPGTPILGFSIQATIHNDTTVEAGWAAGANSHTEVRPRDLEELPYVGPMVDVKLAAEFAIGDTNLLPIAFNYPVGPYREGGSPFIEAVNEDQWGWYCWNPEDPVLEHKPAGGYFVPTWDFGTIPQGQSASRQLVFVVVPPGLQPADPRYAAIVASYAATNDVLMNRSQSLKISTWIDEIALDLGAQQEDPPPLRLSDVSVFHNPYKEEEPEELDFGDAPDTPYPTLLANDGARHVIVPGIFMGAQIDAELDGQPNPTATGDDLLNFPDEDGVTFLNSWVAGQVATVQVVASTSGIVSAWVDYDANGSWGDFGENVLAGAPVVAGTNLVGVNVPAGTATVSTFARFRFTTLPVAMTYTGLVNNGEVEDYPIDVQEAEKPDLDFGDATDSMLIPGGYPTYLANNGARHAIVPGVFLGAAIDAEPDGQPDGTATGDDNAGRDDEDGVTLPPILAAGSSVPIPVVASVPGFLNAWIDWNSDGDWADPGEQVFLNYPLISGANLLLLSVPLPPAFVSGGPESRWRFTTYPPAAPAFVGAETDGEVEDYEVRLEILDFGDAPEPPYPTLLVSTGACHRIPSAYYLGASAPDLDPDGQPSPDAQGDDLAGADDEDGVFTGATLVRGDPSALLGVIVSAPGNLNAWLDFNGDGDWADSGEQVAADLSLPAGVNPLPFAIPADAQVGPVLGRFRFSSLTGLSYAGFASDGEVEDHEFIIYQAGPDTNNFEITNVVYVATNQATIWWVGDTSVVYETQYILDLPSTASPPWTAWGAWVTGEPLMQIDTNAAETAKHYRVVAPYSPPPP